MIEILSSGAANLVQDQGRSGLLHLGISRSGAMDGLALSCANLLAGNPANAAGLEIAMFPFKLRFLGDVRFACTGADAELRLDGEVLPPWWSGQARNGQVLTLGLPRTGARAYLAFAGGIDVPVVLGARATDHKTGFGGLAGRGLKRLDRLSLKAAGEGPAIRGGDVGCVPAGLPAFWRELASGCVTLRVLPAAQYAQFTAESRRILVEAAWQVTRDVNRQGYRLAGSEALRLAEPLELLSHGIVPGTVQVPPAGQPIIQLAEANTCGGYPKIATVIEPNLWRLGQVPSGCAVRFEPVTAETAESIWRAQDAELARLSQCIAPMARRAA